MVWKQLQALSASDASCSAGSWRSEIDSFSWDGAPNWIAQSFDAFPPNVSEDLGYCKCGPCPDDSVHSVIIKILRWIKLIVLRLAHSYYTHTTILFLLPMVVGVVIGWAMGKKHSASQEQVQPRLVGGTLSTVIESIQIRYILLKQSLASMAMRRSPAIKTVGSEPSSYKLATNEDVGESPLSSEPTTKIDKDLPLHIREEQVRLDLSSDRDAQCESGLERSQLPQHIAIIMDGNRRHGKQVYGNATRGHWDGCRKVLDCCKWCYAEHIGILTLYAFSTENWHRSPNEVAALMELFTQYCEELRGKAKENNIRVHVMTTDSEPIPAHVRQGLVQLAEETKECTGMRLNICMSYGSRGEIVHACRSLAQDCVTGMLKSDEIDEACLGQHLLTSDCPDPDIMIRTSGEVRLSNFLLWQLAYAELFFVDKMWPQVTKADLLHILRSFANGRNRRFGK